MDKNSIKRYAVWARRELIERVSQKAMQYGITETEIVPATAESIRGKLLSKTEIAQRTALIAQIKSKGYQQVIEEVAYTWFNRFSAIRFMEVNGYLPSHVRVFTDEENNFKPQILAEALHLDIDGLKTDVVIELKQENKTEELYKYLIITQCNALGKILPGMFQRIEDYTELLFPDNLLREGSVVQQMVEMIPEEDWTEQVQIIGWLYQYYNTEPKDKVFADLKKNIKITKENIPAATQLFTPDWIVRYMVENSLGRLWIEHLRGAKGSYIYHYDDNGQNDGTVGIGDQTVERLKSNWKYYLEEAEQEPSVEAELAKIRAEYAEIKPEEIKVIDPCMGSGHILAYMFDVLVQIYESYGYPTRDAVRSIVDNNIFGLDIDDRAAQLAYFSVMMKARQYDKRYFSRKDEDGKPDVRQPNVFAIVESNDLSRDAVDYFTHGDDKLTADFDSICREMHDAKEYGSILNITSVDFEALYNRVDECHDDVSLFSSQVQDQILPLIRVAEALALCYDAVVTNPPYMGNKSMTKKLQNYIERFYPNSEGDLSTVFMEVTLKMCGTNRMMSMINIPVWMFSASYTTLRKALLKSSSIVNMLHFGRGVFGADFGTTSFVFINSNLGNRMGTYKRLFKSQSSVDTVETKKEFFYQRDNAFYASMNDFSIMPNSTLAYWASKPYRNAFKNLNSLSHCSDVKKGTTTGDDDTFLRLWHEVTSQKISIIQNDNRKLKWHPFNKGGEFRRWYGNNNYVVNWENEGYLIKNNRGENGKLKSRPQNIGYFYREGLTWTYISISKISFRYYPQGFAFAAAGPAVFPHDKKDTYCLLAFLNSKVAQNLVNFIGGTGVTYETGEVSNIPTLLPQQDELFKLVNTLVEKAICFSKHDWDSFETSWDFKKHPFLQYATFSPQQVKDEEQKGFLTMDGIAKSFSRWEQACEDRFNQLKANEEELNRIFIDIYGLQDELTPDVEDKDVTVRKADLGRDVRSFISYAVGCMFGRYSLDVEGLAYAGGKWDESKYTTFEADKDNVIPICDDEYFDDDIVGKFVKFVEVVYGRQTLEDNLKFIADALGGSGRPRDVIRKYFLNDFYNDHLKIYQKRPIYWQFDSGKKNGFKCLIYMHRYQPDTIARIRTDYVHEQQGRYRTAIADLEQRIQSATTSERVKLNKQLQNLKEQDAEIHAFEEKVHHLADQMIRIDLDDGVKHNYEIFKDVLTKLK